MSWTRWLLLGDLSQQLDLNDLQSQVQRLRRKLIAESVDQQKIGELTEELLELEVRHDLLVRLLISKGIISAQEYADVIASAQSQQPAEEPKNPEDNPFEGLHS